MVIARFVILGYLIMHRIRLNDNYRTRLHDDYIPGIFLLLYSCSIGLFPRSRVYIHSCPTRVYVVHLSSLESYGIPFHIHGHAKNL